MRALDVIKNMYNNKSKAIKAIKTIEKQYKFIHVQAMYHAILNIFKLITNEYMNDKHGDDWSDTRVNVDRYYDIYNTNMYLIQDLFIVVKGWIN